MVMPVPELHRAYLQDMRALSHDEQGREILVGLTFDETEALIELMFSRWDISRSLEHIDRDAGRERQLYEKHELARLAIVVGESEARQAGPKH
jgi:hypothetical protein